MLILVKVRISAALRDHCDPDYIELEISSVPHADAVLLLKSIILNKI